MNDIGGVAMAIATLTETRRVTRLQTDKEDITDYIDLLKNTLLYLTREIKEEYETNNRE